jgi:hypothetical protein
MSQPVKLSDELVLDARIAGEAQERSIAGQVEFWAKLGRSMEFLLEGRQVLTLCRTVGATPLAELVERVDSPKGRKTLKTFLESEPYPHFEAHPTQPGVLIRIEESGERIMGRFVNRTFVPVITGDKQKIELENARLAKLYRQHVPGERPTKRAIATSSEHGRRLKEPATV